MRHSIKKYRSHARPTLLLVVVAMLTSHANAQSESKPLALANRIKIVTIAGPNLHELEAAYTTSMGLVVRRRGTISREVAVSWGALRMADQPYIMLSPEGSPDVYIRCVQIDAVKGYRPQTTAGWNAYELMVGDLGKLRQTLEHSRFKVIQEPHHLNGAFATAVAMTVEGPAQEIIYLTSDQGDQSQSTFLIPRSQVDRPIGVILGGSDWKGLRDFYVSHLQMTSGPSFSTPIVPLNQALGLAPNNPVTMTSVMARESHNFIEIDGLPQNMEHRARPVDQLPPGNAMVSFGVSNLDEIKVEFISPPQARYGGQRAASFFGPAGELVELFEEKPSH